MKLNLLLVIDNIEFGGGERVFLQLAGGLKDQFKVFVAATSGGRFEKELNELRIKFCPVNMSQQLSFQPICKITNIIRKSNIDLVHSQGARADFFARIAARIGGVSRTLCTITTPVEGFDVGPVKKTIYRFLDKLSERYVDRFFVVSDSLKNTLVEKRGISPERVIRIYNGIELDRFRPDLKKPNLKKQLGIAPDVPLIGAIGRMVWEKGFEYLIAAVPKILHVSQEATFLLVGEGPLRHDLEGLARDLHVHEKVIFTGFRSDIQHLLSIIDVLAVPSLLEGFPMITLEAMAMAKPIVATQINGITEQISGGLEGILVPQRSPADLAAGLLKVIQDKKLASGLGAAARKRVENCFSLERMVRETQQAYLSLLK
jgi:glycosyltransferase involved in cell wall biosynthesis